MSRSPFETRWVWGEEFALDRRQAAIPRSATRSIPESWPHFSGHWSHIQHLRELRRPQRIGLQERQREALELRALIPQWASARLYRSSKSFIGEVAVEVDMHQVSLRRVRVVHAIFDGVELHEPGTGRPTCRLGRTASHTRLQCGTADPIVRI